MMETNFVSRQSQNTVVNFKLRFHLLSGIVVGYCITRMSALAISFLLYDVGNMTAMALQSRPIGVVLD